MMTQETQESILEMKGRGLSNSNIAAILDIEEKLVGVVAAQAKVKVDRLPKPKKKAQDIRPDVPWVHPENIGFEENWEVEGLCRTGGYDPDLWFPSPTEFKSNVRLAQRVCYRCPVIMECRTIALARGERNGIWGGLTETQRKKMRKTAREEAV